MEKLSIAVVIMGFVLVAMGGVSVFSTNDYIENIAENTGENSVTSWVSNMNRSTSITMNTLVFVMLLLLGVLIGWTLIRIGRRGWWRR